MAAASNLQIALKGLSPDFSASYSIASKKPRPRKLKNPKLTKPK